MTLINRAWHRSRLWRTEHEKWDLAILVVCVLAAVGLLLVLINWVLEDGSVDRMSVVTGLAVVIGVALTGFGLRNTYETVRVSQRTLQHQKDANVSERYFKAVEQLGSESVDVRIGALYSLSALMKHSDEFYQPCIDVALQFVRRRSPWVKSAPGIPLNQRLDVQVAIRVLTRRRPNPYSGIREPLDFGALYLEGMTFVGSWLEQSSFIGSYLENALMSHSMLRGADFTRAICGKVDFTYSELSHARFASTNLFKATFFNLRPGAPQTYIVSGDTRHKHDPPYRQTFETVSDELAEVLPFNINGMVGTLFMNRVLLFETDFINCDLSKVAGLTIDDLKVAIPPRDQLSMPVDHTRRKESEVDGTES